MKIELKKISVNEGLSEETTAFHAELFVNGVNVGYAKNSGHGGPTDCHPHHEHRELFKQAEDFCLTLPPMKIPAKQGKGFEYPMDLETFVELLLENHLKEKDAKKLVKQMDKAILFEDDRGINVISWKGKTLAQMPLPVLQATYDKYKAKLKPNQKCLNTNLAKLGVKL